MANRADTEDLFNAVQHWKRLSTTLANSQPSYKSFADIYDLLRESPVKNGKRILEGEDVRAALASLSASRLSQHTACAITCKKMFLDLVEVWETPWESEDYTAVFETFEWHRAAHESIATIEIIHRNKGLGCYPDADCWRRVFGSLSGRSHEETLQLSKEAWS